MKLTVRTPKAVTEQDRTPARQPDNFGFSGFSSPVWRLLKLGEGDRRISSGASDDKIGFSEALEEKVEKSV
jgi:hypothetical protein